jgi:hypothetical protein
MTTYRNTTLSGAPLQGTTTMEFATPGREQVIRFITADALLVALGAPLIQFNRQGNPMLDASGNAIMRKPARESLALAELGLTALGSHYLKEVGPPQLRDEIDLRGDGFVARLMTCRHDLMKYFPGMRGRTAALATTTGDLPDLLADVLRKAVLGHFLAGRRSWKGWAKQGNIADYKLASRVRLDELKLLPAKGEAEEIKTEVWLDDVATERFRLKGYASILALTWEVITANEVARIAAGTQAIASAATRLEDSLAYAVLTGNPEMSDGEELFSVAHANSGTGALSAASMGTLASLIAKQTNSHGELLDLQAARLVCPSALRFTAQTLLDQMSSAQLAEREQPIQLVTSAHLDADSATKFYLACDPATRPAVELAFLSEDALPRITQQEDGANDTVAIKLRHDVVAAAIDHRSIARSSGS